MHLVYKLDHLFQSTRVSDENSSVTKTFHFSKLFSTQDLFSIQHAAFKRSEEHTSELPSPPRRSSDLHLFQSTRVSDENSSVTKTFHFSKLFSTQDLFSIQHAAFK